MDKLQKLEASIKLVNDKLHFQGVVEGNQPISIDYIPPLGDDLGYTSLELLLMSLSSCVASSVLVFLRTMQKKITGLEIQATGLRKSEHPTGFHTITLDLQLKSADTTAEDLAKVIKLTEETYCPVHAMLSKSVKIEINSTILAL